MNCFVVCTCVCVHCIMYTCSASCRFHATQPHTLQPEPCTPHPTPRSKQIIWPSLALFGSFSGLVAPHWIGLAEPDSLRHHTPTEASRGANYLWVSFRRQLWL